MKVLADVIARWRRDASTLDEYGAEAEARAVRKCAVEMEAAILEMQLEALTLKDAERESGYSYSALQQMVANGEVPNAGKKHGPRIRRRDLPRKPGRRSTALAPGETDLADMVMAAR